jgi:hypothetical protein
MGALKIRQPARPPRAAARAVRKDDLLNTLRQIPDEWIEEVLAAVSERTHEFREQHREAWERAQREDEPPAA